jgi:hypothetical protein
VGALLAMISVVTIAQSFANRQHSSVFYELDCATYPLVLTAQSSASRLRAPASAAALAYLGMVGSMVWALPLFAATPQAGPVYNSLDHLLAPPFPLLLIVPALALDSLLHGIPSREAGRRLGVGARVRQVAGAVRVTQWVFSAFALVRRGWLAVCGRRPNLPFFCASTRRRAPRSGACLPT